MSETKTAITLYYSPKACSLASHVVLEESGLPYDAVAVDIRTGGNRTDAYLAINPSGIVPTLAVGDARVTESHAILTYIADRVPEKRLIPIAGTLERARAHEWMNFISSSMHVAFRSIFRPEVYAGNRPESITGVRQKAYVTLRNILEETEHRLAGRQFALGAFSIVDAYLFVFYIWSFDERIDEPLPARPRYAALAGRVWQRPTVRKVMAREWAVRRYKIAPEFERSLSET